MNYYLLLFHSRSYLYFNEELASMLLIPYNIYSLVMRLRTRFLLNLSRNDGLPHIGIRVRFKSTGRSSAYSSSPCGQRRLSTFHNLEFLMVKFYLLLKHFIRIQTIFDLLILSRSNRYQLPALASHGASRYKQVSTLPKLLLEGWTAHE